MDLRSGNAYWLLKNGLLASYPPLTRNEQCDVAIIGGGITGALVAHGLVREGVDTVLLDKRDVATGSTAASTSLLQYEIDTELADLIDRIGRAERRASLPCRPGGDRSGRSCRTSWAMIAALSARKAFILPASRLTCETRARV